MAFVDYETFANPIELPIRGKTYVLPEIGAKLGVRLQLLMDQAVAQAKYYNDADQARQKAEEAGEEPPVFDTPPEVTEKDPTPQEMLGDVYDEMVEDDVPMKVIRLASTVLSQDFYFNREAAEEYWAAGGDPKEMAKKLPASNPFTTNGDEETTTQKPASTSGTKSKTKNSRSTTAGQKASATPKSSKSGGSSKARSKQSSESN